MSNPANVLFFCPPCFATEEEGSGGSTCDGVYCYNCGSGGTVALPRWAIVSIREQASWVGKRFYPHDEDREAHDELAALRRRMTTFPGRTARPPTDTKPKWRVEQKRGKSTVMVWVDADSEEEALEQTKDRLPWCPEGK